jgi:predicted MFS family arabinose efflux permease
MSLMPVLARWVIDNHGWRNAYLWVGLGWGAFVLVLLLPFFVDTRRVGRFPQAPPRREAPLGAALGLSLSEALRSPALLSIAGATLMSVLTLTAITVHQVPILTERGLSRETAALIAGGSGVAAIAGRLVTGIMLDRWRGGWVGGISLLLPAISCLALLHAERHLSLTVLAVLLVGYGGGSFMPICSYLTSRYGGLRSFGKIFGVVSSLVALGIGTGPVAAGLIFDRFGSYSLLLLLGFGANLISCFLLLGLAPYPKWTEEKGSTV